VADVPRLSLRERLSWCAHLWKAATQQHHRAYAPLFRRYVPHDGVVCDVGAHAGQFAKLFAGIARDGKVYAVEPGGYALSILRRVMALHRLTNVEIVAAGLSDGARAETLHVPVKRSGSMGYGLSHLGAESRASASETVTLTTLDAFAAEKQLAQLDFIKADIEGWEMRMLAGGKAAIARFRPALLLEVQAAHLARTGDTPADIWRFFAPLGYEAQLVLPEGSGIRLAPAPEACEGDVLWAPRKPVLTP
jgi:FkbM family methyltransferase